MKHETPARGTIHLEDFPVTSVQYRYHKIWVIKADYMHGNNIMLPSFVYSPKPRHSYTLRARNKNDTLWMVRFYVIADARVSVRTL